MGIYKDLLREVVRLQEVVAMSVLTVFILTDLELLLVIVQSFYGKKSVNLPLIATEGFSTVLDSAMYPY